VIYRFTPAMAQDAFDVDSRSRAEKIQALAARPGTVGEGAAAKAALSRINKPGSAEQKRDNKGQFASTNAVAASHGWEKQSALSSGGKPYATTHTHPKFPGAELTTFHHKDHENAWTIQHPPDREGHNHIETGGKYHQDSSAFARRAKEISDLGF
jgi:hypothetical protein